MYLFIYSSFFSFFCLPSFCLSFFLSFFPFKEIAQPALKKQILQFILSDIILTALNDNHKIICQWIHDLTFHQHVCVIGLDMRWQPKPNIAYSLLSVDVDSFCQNLVLLKIRCFELGVNTKVYSPMARKSSLTFMAVLADVSIKSRPVSSAYVWASFYIQHNNKYIVNYIIHFRIYNH